MPHEKRIGPELVRVIGRLGDPPDVGNIALDHLLLQVERGAGLGELGKQVLYDRSCYLVNMTSGAVKQRDRTQRRPRADGERTRGAILRAAASLATIDGLEGLSIGNLAAATGMSKSGLYAHFGSKQELQLATVEEAGRILDEEVAQPALAAPLGLAQLVAVCEAFFDYLQRRVFPGGCFFAAAALEMGTRPGPVKERVAALQAGFAALVRGFAATALEQHELPAREDPDRLTFELYGIMLAADTNFVLHDDPVVLNLARQIVHQRLGLGNGGNAGEATSWPRTAAWPRNVRTPGQTADA